MAAEAREIWPSRLLMSTLDKKSEICMQLSRQGPCQMLIRGPQPRLRSGAIYIFLLWQRDVFVVM